MVFASSPEVPTVDAEEAHRLHEDGTAVIVDVREPFEWEEARIPGATHIPLGALGDRVDELPEDRTVILQCRSGARSADACAQLLQAGLEEVYNLEGGILAWHRAGFPVDG